MTIKMEETPIENHPRFSKPDVRFRHMRTRKAYRKIKEMGINTFMRPVISTNSKP
jgi:hypothetical protein